MVLKMAKTQQDLLLLLQQLAEAPHGARHEAAAAAPMPAAAAVAVAVAAHLSALKLSSSSSMQATTRLHVRKLVQVLVL
jgi:hypothetical protein